MQIKYGAVNTDAHAQLDKDTWTNRMSKAKWGGAIPQLKPTADKKHYAVDWGEKDVYRWFINDEVVDLRSVCNCPTVMQDPKWGEAGAHRKYFPQRWADVPKKVYVPTERLKALDEDGIDAEVMFFNNPVQSGSALQHPDPAFELEVVQAYNDGVGEWRKFSDRFIPLTMLPYLSGIETTIEELERATKMGHRGPNMVPEPSHRKKELKHLADRYWDPLWAAAQDLEVPINWHGGGVQVGMDAWKGFTQNERQGFGGSGAATMNLTAAIFSGIMDRYPRLQWHVAEVGAGWVNYVVEGCDYEWEKRRLWEHGLPTRPSEIFQRNWYVSFWFEQQVHKQRFDIGMDRIMWLNDYPHSTAIYPESWEFIEKTLAGVPQEDRDQMLWKNADRLFKLGAVDARK
jgi:predicted TIM-barrel fold metal-dependent hydrolase